MGSQSLERLREALRDEASLTKALTGWWPELASRLSREIDFAKWNLKVGRVREGMHDDLLFELSDRNNGGVFPGRLALLRPQEKADPEGFAFSLVGADIEREAVLGFLKKAVRNEKADVLLKAIDGKPGKGSAAEFECDFEVELETGKEGASTSLSARPSGGEKPKASLFGGADVEILQLSASSFEGQEFVSANLGLDLGNGEIVELQFEVPANDEDRLNLLRLVSPLKVADGLKSMAGLARKIIAGVDFPQFDLKKDLGVNFLDGVTLYGLEIGYGGNKVKLFRFDLRSMTPWKLTDGVKLLNLGISGSMAGGRWQIRPNGMLVFGNESEQVVLSADLNMPLGQAKTPWELTIMAEMDEDQGFEKLCEADFMSGLKSALSSEMLGEDARAAKGISLSPLRIGFTPSSSPTLNFLELGIHIRQSLRFSGLAIFDPTFAMRYDFKARRLEYLKLESGLAFGDGVKFTVSGEYTPEGWVLKAASGGTPFSVGQLWKCGAETAPSMPGMVADFKISQLELRAEFRKPPRYYFHLLGETEQVQTDFTLDIGEEKTIEGNLDFGDKGLRISSLFEDDPLGKVVHTLREVSLLDLGVSYHDAPRGPETVNLEASVGISEGRLLSVGYYRGIEKSDKGGAKTTAAAVGLVAKFGLNTKDVPLLGKLVAPSDLFVVDEILLILGPKAPLSFKFIPEHFGSLRDAVEGGWLLGVVISGDKVLKIPIEGGSPKSALGRSAGERKEGATLRADFRGRLGEGKSGDAWLKLNKTIGPVTIVSLSGEVIEGRPSLKVEARIKFAGLELELYGLAISIPFSAELPRLSLRGLGFSKNSGGLQIAASLDILTGEELERALKDDDWKWLASGKGGSPTLALKGGFLLSTARFGLAGSGLYAQFADFPVLVAQLSVNAVIGGPPAFFVTGLNAALGVNVALRSPTLEDLDTFPLLADRPDYGKWISPAQGQFWISAGVNFTSFQVIEAKAALLAKFGDELEFALLGRATASFPRGAEKIFASITLKLMASVRPTEGVLSVIALVSSDSFLLDRNCRLVGGAAYSVWMAGPHAGDFVLSVGGYHPKYAVKAHYPIVPRVGIDWQISKALSLRGEYYFAITPDTMMFGGKLDLRLDADALRAWLHIDMDALVNWAPFHFEITSNVRVGVSYTFSVLGLSGTLDIEVAAAVSLCGPPVAGYAEVDCGIIVFTIQIGDEEKKTIAPSWSDISRLLPADPVTVNLIAGVVEKKRKNSAGDTVVPVRGEDFAFSVESAIPASEIVIPGIAGDFGRKPAIYLRPFKLKAKGRLVLLIRNARHGELDFAGWTATPITRNFPPALWGEEKDRELLPCVAGVRLVPPVPVPGGASAQAVLRFDVARRDLGLIEWLTESTPRSKASLDAGWKIAGESGLNFRDFLVPTLAAGETYGLSAAMTVTPDGTPGPGVQTYNSLINYIQAAMPPLVLAPEEISSLHPPANDSGDHSRTLPHIVLRRSLLPWAFQPPGATTAVRPWLALLVFAQGELQEGDPGSATGTYAGTVGKTPGSWGTSTWLFPSREGWDPSTPCRYIGCKTDLLKKILPTEEETALLTHVRQQQEKDAAEKSNIWHGVVLANRLPRADSRSVVHLVSLRGLEALWRNPACVTVENVCLYSLASWTFAATGRHRSFREVGEQIITNQKNTTTDLGLRPKWDPGSATPPGYILLRDRAFAPDNVMLYRGPFCAARSEAPRTPIENPTAAILHREEKGLEDVRLAVAWQAGQLQAAADGGFVRDLVRLRLQATRGQHQVRLLQRLQTSFGPASAANRISDALAGELKAFMNGSPASGGPALDEGAPAGRAWHEDLGLLTTRAEGDRSAGKGAGEMLQVGIASKGLFDSVVAKLADFLLLRELTLEHIIERDSELNYDHLPEESLRLFRVDMQWLGAYLDGLLSVGDRLDFTDELANSLRNEVWKELAARGGTPEKSDPLALDLNGVLIDSEMISIWPEVSLEARQKSPAAGEQRKSLCILRRRRIDERRMLWIIAGAWDELILSQPAQTFHFELKPTDIAVYDRGVGVIRIKDLAEKQCLPAAVSAATFAVEAVPALGQIVLTKKSSGK